MKELILQIINAKSEKEREEAYGILERVGMDRYTVNVIIKELLDRYKAKHTEVTSA